MEKNCSYIEYKMKKVAIIILLTDIKYMSLPKPQKDTEKYDVII